MNVRHRKWRIIFVATLLVLAAAALLIFPELFLRVSSPPVLCDAIVLLGGGPGERDPIAAELYQNAVAPLIVITGKGSCLYCADALAAKGVPTNAMFFECEATSTKENAEAVARIARKKHFTDIVLVTSWFHSRRAVCTFHKFAPALRVHPVVADIHRPFRYELRQIGSEYAKILYYAIRWQVPLWT